MILILCMRCPSGTRPALDGKQLVMQKRLFVVRVTGKSFVGRAFFKPLGERRKTSLGRADCWKLGSRAS